MSTKHGTHIGLLRKNKNKCSGLYYNLTMILNGEENKMKAAVKTTNKHNVDLNKTNVESLAIHISKKRVRKTVDYMVICQNMNLKNQLAP